MNIVRMFAIVAAVLITAFLFTMFADGLTSEQPVHAATSVAANGAATSDSPQSAAD